MVRLDGLTAASDEGAFDEVAQFPDVSRVVVGLQGAERRGTGLFCDFCRKSAKSAIDIHPRLALLVIGLRAG